MCEARLPTGGHNDLQMTCEMGDNVVRNDRSLRRKLWGDSPCPLACSIYRQLVDGTMAVWGTESISIEVAHYILRQVENTRNGGLEKGLERERDRQTDRQTHSETNRQKNSKSGKQKKKYNERWQRDWAEKHREKRKR